MIRTGRADLVRAFAARGDAGLACTARMLGYREEPTRGPRTYDLEPTADAPRREDPAIRITEPAEIRFAPVPLWRLESAESLEEPAEDGGTDGEAALEASELAPKGPMPDPEPIVPWPRLWPALREALRSAVPSREVDVAELVERWGRGESLDELPLREASAWSRRVTLLVDRGPRLIPFWSDQDELCRRLRRTLGRAGVRVARGLEGPRGPWLHGRAGARAPSPVPVQGETVVAVGDLGFYESGRLRTSWARWGRHLRRRGARLRALVPCPAARWQRAVAGPWRAIDWSAPMRTAASGRPADEDLAARRDRLLSLVSPATRVEPGLLRAIRRLLPAGDADAGTEADVWSHPEVDGSSSVALGVETPADRPSPWREAFRAEPVELRAAVVAEILRWHAGLPQDIWLGEAQALVGGGGEDGALPPDEEDRAKRFTLWLSRGVAGSAAGGRSAAGYFLRFSTRLPPALWTSVELGRPLARGWAAASRGDPDRALPPGLTPAMLDDEVPRTPRLWTVWQVGASLQFRPADASEEPPAGTALATLLAARPEIDIAAGRFGWQRRCPLGDSPRPVPSPPGPSLVLTTDRARVELRRFERPDWAARAGRNRQGLWVEAPLAAPPLGAPSLGAPASRRHSETTRLRWQPPEPAPAGSTDAPDTGTWTAEAWPSWASGAGHDEFGLWVSVGVDGVQFRMRWAPPGRFLMGSPENEQGRWEDEGPRHEVTLTRGFWIAETPCTQALWEAVTGKSPSRFESPDRPVEQVSWEDCQQFLIELNERIPELGARLPTEAEWEYACRAGTKTSTYAGELEILETGEAPLADEIAWYSKNTGGGTHPVAQKRPNRWGLYDMLGNVWEWCADYWQARYPARLVEDPTGPDEGSLRVIRGGAWGEYARIVRCASRYAHAPGDRYEYLGFRLARGPLSPLAPLSHPPFTPARERGDLAAGGGRQGTGGGAPLPGGSEGGAGEGSGERG
jgi:hypothetical protein